MTTQPTTTKPHKIICENQKNAIISGIDKVESVNLNQITMITNGTLLLIWGNNLHITKLDVVAGNVEISGQIDGFKYMGKKQNIFKRIFK